jgi:hypothetical protein
MGTPGIRERLDDAGELQRSTMENQEANLRVACPGIIVSFDAASQTASVQPAIREIVRVGDGPETSVDLPVLTDVPVQFPGGGGFTMTFPVEKGDECLLTFSDMCIDGWWQSGGVQDQMDKRRHDLSDAMAHMGFSSAPNAVENPSKKSIMLRNKDGSTFVEVANGSVNIKASSINLN